MRLTKLDIYWLNQEVEELTETIELCSEKDQDVLEDIAKRLDEICIILENSLKVVKIRIIK